MCLIVGPSKHPLLAWAGREVCNCVTVAGPGLQAPGPPQLGSRWRARQAAGSHCNCVTLASLGPTTADSHRLRGIGAEESEWCPPVAKSAE